MALIKTALQEVFLAPSVTKSMVESIIRYDFKIGHERAALMQLCFSSLATWPTAVTLFLVYWFEFNMNELFFKLVLVLIFGISLARIFYLWILLQNLQSETRNIWKKITLMHLGAWISSAIIATTNATLNATVNRAEFLLFSFSLIYFLTFIFCSLWGHFYFKKKKDPATFYIRYSTAAWLNRRSPRLKLKNKVVKTVQLQIDVHQKNLNDLSTIKDLSPVSVPLQISKILQTELEFLTLASSQLTIK